MGNLQRRASCVVRRAASAGGLRMISHKRAQFQYPQRSKGSIATFLIARWITKASEFSSADGLQRSNLLLLLSEGLVKFSILLSSATKVISQLTHFIFTIHSFLVKLLTFSIKFVL